MLRWLLLLVAVALLALGCLTVAKSPDALPWQLAVLAGEFGHWFAIAALFTGLVGWWLRGEQAGVGGAILLCAIAAVVLLLVPAFQAWRIAGDLPSRFATQLPAGRAPGIPFSVKQLFLGQDPAPVPMQTLKTAEGLPLDFYRVPTGSGARGVPCVIVVHGGGWDGGDRRQIPELNHWLARRGYAVAAISYRLAPKFRWPKQGDDVMTAIAFLKEKAGELGIDPSRFVLLGRSAGGQIAEMVAYTAGDPAIRGVVGFYAPTDLHFGYVNTREDDALQSPALMRQFLGGPPETARAIYDAASPLLHVTKEVPPTLLLHGENDTLVWHRHSERLETMLKEHGVPSMFVSLPWATHAFEFNLHGPGGQLTTFSLGWFLSAVTK